MVATLPFVLDERDGPLGHERADASADSALALPAVLRALRPIVGDGAVMAAGSAPALERLSVSADPPSVSRCDPLERDGARAVSMQAPTAVRAFLDGIQRSRLVGHVGGAPLVFGTVAAVVRQRENRRLVTWQTPRIRRALFASRVQLGEAVWSRLRQTAIPLVDVTESTPEDAVSPHPMAIRARALELVALEREQAERQLAAAWCASERDWLWVDGGIAGNLAIDENATAFGVVKSHNTLYGDTASVRAVLALRTGERSPAFLAGHRPRRAVASWYVRLRDASNGDPLHGLVRVEVAPPVALLDSVEGSIARQRALEEFSAHVDQLSSWILAERAPLALPDPRWDTLTYGVYACEQYLKSIIGSS